MMGFGFVVARFGLFLREIAILSETPSPRYRGMSIWVGVALVVLGVVVNLAAAFNHWQTVRRLERGEPLRFRRLSLAAVVAIAVGMLGVVMAAYLSFGVNPAG
jgi:putative membrane protein